MTGIDKTTDRNALTNTQALHLCTKRADGAYDLMAGNNGEIRTPPIIVGKMNIGMAYPAKFNRNLHVFGTHISARDCVRCEWRRCRLRCVACCGRHKILP